MQGDSTPDDPSGVVVAALCPTSQLDTSFTGFVDRDTSVESIDLVVSTPSGVLLSVSLTGAPEGWTGPLSEQPSNGERIRAHVSAKNSVGLVTNAYSSFVTWDTLAPNVTSWLLFSTKMQAIT